MIKLPKILIVWP